MATVCLVSVSCTCDCQNDTLICRQTDNLTDPSPECVSDYSEISVLRIINHANLEVVDSELLSRFSNLTSLDISYNPNLVLIRNTSFEGLEHLSSLRISHNKKLMSIPDNCLDSLYNLTVLVLAQNGFDEYTTNGFRFCVQVNYLGQYNVLPLGFRFKEAVLVPQRPSKESVDFCMQHRMQLLFEEHQGHPGCEISNDLIDCSSDKIADSIGTGNSSDFPNGKDEECHFYFNLLTHTYRSYINETGDYRARQYGEVNVVIELVSNVQTVSSWTLTTEFNSSLDQLVQGLEHALPWEDRSKRNFLELNLKENFGINFTAPETNSTTTNDTTLAMTTTSTTTTTTRATSITDNNSAGSTIAETSTSDVSTISTPPETSVTTMTDHGATSLTGIFLQLHTGRTIAAVEFPKPWMYKSSEHATYMLHNRYTILIRNACVFALKDTNTVDVLVSNFQQTCFHLWRRPD